MSTRTDNQPGGETQRGMKIARWAAVPTLLMALPNVPVGLDSSGTHMPAGIGWAATVVGLAGLIAGIALMGHPARSPKRAVAKGGRIGITEWGRILVASQVGRAVASGRSAYANRSAPPRHLMGGVTTEQIEPGGL
ncbi:MAG: hypothetical protein M3N98_00240 [Actinomycetota bacterium]|nr:hypothetical protein [Actinomycetota bacterium]